MIIVLTTYEDRNDALKFAELALVEKLASCVQVAASPVTSLYTWQGNLKKDAEFLVSIKTTENKLPALEKRLHETHPYEVPQFIVITATASQKYNAWLES